jgi:hypothetical protein
MLENMSRPTHDTKSPLGCCPRCYKAELAGRARRRPVFRYDKVEAAERPSTYDVFHGDQHVATLSRRGAAGPAAYEVRVDSDAGEQELRAASLRDARALAEETYTTTWREGRHVARGPVRDL